MPYYKMLPSPFISIWYACKYIPFNKNSIKVQKEISGQIVLDWNIPSLDIFFSLIISVFMENKKCPECFSVVL